MGVDWNLRRASAAASRLQSPYTVLMLDSRRIPILGSASCASSSSSPARSSLPRSSAAPPARRRRTSACSRSRTGKGMVMLDLKGSVLGRLVDRDAPGNRPHTVGPLFGPRRRAQAHDTERLGPKTILYRGQGLRFRMVGGGYRIVVRGAGISVSAVGRGRRRARRGAAASRRGCGVYSLEDGVDCDVERALCTALPDEPERFTLGRAAGDGPVEAPRSEPAAAHDPRRRGRDLDCDLRRRISPERRIRRANRVDRAERAASSSRASRRR